MRKPPFVILYEDRDVIVIDKAAGLLTTHTHLTSRAARDSQLTAENLVSDYLRKGQIRSSRRAWLVHRLDRETSGVLMFAKSPEVAEELRNAWHERTKKEYLAWVKGSLKASEGRYESYLREDPKTYKVFETADPQKGKYACTTWRRVRETSQATLVEIALETGRKNQIRVQFASRGNPVVGDVKYGGPKAKRLYLHAARLTVHLPNGQTQVCESPCEFINLKNPVGL